MFSHVSLAELVFIDCTFHNCDLSNVNLNNTAFQEVYFVNCKLLGLRFDTCKLFLLEFNFNSCTLNYASFFGLKIPETKFHNSSLL